MIKPKSKASRFSKTTAVQQAATAGVLQAAEEEGIGQQQLLSIARVVPGLVNPRLIVNGEAVHLSWEEVKGGVPDTDPLYALKSSVIQHIRGLALSILRSQQVSPVIVYEDGDSYILTDGECRYWAVRLASDKEYVSGLQTSVPFTVKAPYILAIKKPEPPAKMRTVQNLSNMVRKGMELSQTMHSITDLMGEHIDQLDGLSDIEINTFIGELIGKNRETVRQYRKLTGAQGPVGERIYKAIQEGRLMSLQKANALLEFPNNKKSLPYIDRAIKETMGEEGIKVLLAECKKTQQDATPVEAPRRKGRPPSYGVKISSGNVAKHLIERVLGKERVPDIDWGNKRQVEKALLQMVEEFAKGVESNEAE